MSKGLDDAIAKSCARAVGEGVGEWSEFARVLLRGCVSVADGAQGHVARVGLGEGDRRANRTWDGCFAVAIEGARGVHTRPDPDRSQIGARSDGRPDTCTTLRDRSPCTPRTRVHSSVVRSTRSSSYCVIRHAAHTYTEGGAARAAGRGGEARAGRAGGVRTSGSSGAAAGAADDVPRLCAQRSIVAFVGGAPPGTFMDATFCAFLPMHGGTALLSPACQ